MGYHIVDCQPDYLGAEHIRQSRNGSHEHAECEDPFAALQKTHKKLSVKLFLFFFFHLNLFGYYRDQ
jgi:hypothetical protein